MPEYIGPYVILTTLKQSGQIIWLIPGQKFEAEQIAAQASQALVQ